MEREGDDVVALGEIGEEGWYSGGEAIDTACRDGFLDLWQAALDGGTASRAE